MYLHNYPNFKDLIEITSSEVNINPTLIEKDYWIMNVLYHLSKLFEFQMKGGTSLSKGFKIIDRFSEDIDIQIKPPEEQLDFTVYYGKNHDKGKHIQSRKKYFDWIKNKLKGAVNGIEDVKRDNDFDGPRCRNAGIRLYYKSMFSSLLDIKEGILLELGFDKTTPNVKRDISSWIFDRANLKNIHDNRAKKIVCYKPEYTFVEKLDAVVRKYNQYQEAKTISKNFLRHYYDLYCLLNQPDVQSFIGTNNYQKYKKERLKKLSDSVRNHEAFILSDSQERKILEREYLNQENLYYKGQIPFLKILDRIKDYAGKF